MSTENSPRGAWVTIHEPLGYTIQRWDPDAERPDPCHAPVHILGRQVDAVITSARSGLEALGAALRDAIPAITEAARVITEATTEPYPDRPDTRRARRHGRAAQNSPYGPARRHRR